MRTYVVSTDESFAAQTKAALAGEVRVYASTAEAVSRLLQAGSSNLVLVLDLASGTDAARTIEFVKLSGSLRHARIIGVGSEQDCARLGPPGMELLDGCVKTPFTAEQLATAVSGARQARAVL